MNVEPELILGKKILRVQQEKGIQVLPIVTLDGWYHSAMKPVARSGLPAQQVCFCINLLLTYEKVCGWNLVLVQYCTTPLIALIELRCQLVDSCVLCGWCLC